MIVVSNYIIFPQEDIQFIDFCIPRLSILFRIHIIEHNIEIISPVIELGNMSFLQCIVNCQLMKMEILQDGTAGFRWLIYKIYPQKSLLVLDKFRKLFGRNIFSNGFP